MDEATVASDNDRAEALFEAMLTVTIQVLLRLSDAVMKVASGVSRAQGHARALECACDIVVVFGDRLKIVVSDTGDMTHAKCLDRLK